MGIRIQRVGIQQQHIRLTLRRHFLNNNPTNPFQPYDPNFVTPPRFGITTTPLAWVGFDAFAMGWIMYAWTGAFIPIPVDTLLGYMGDTAWGAAILGTTEGQPDLKDRPPGPKKFKVKNK